MISLDDINALIEARKNRVLTCAQVGMNEFQFKAFRKLFLDEFGRSGLLSDLERLLANSSNTHEQERQGTGRHTLRNKGGVPWVQILNNDYAIHVELNKTIESNISEDELCYLMEYLPEIYQAMMQYITDEG